jgi:hypothetical protein
MVVNESLQSLKKIQAATNVGVNYPTYGQLLIDAKAKTDEVKRTLPDGELKNELIAAMDSYEAAKVHWTKARQQESMMSDTEPYNLKSREAIDKFFDERVETKSVAERNRRENWEAASQHVEKASKLAE